MTFHLCILLRPLFSLGLIHKYKKMNEVNCCWICLLDSRKKNEWLKPVRNEMIEFRNDHLSTIHQHQHLGNTIHDSFLDSSTPFVAQTESCGLFTIPCFSHRSSMHVTEPQIALKQEWFVRGFFNGDIIIYILNP